MVSVPTKVAANQPLDAATLAQWGDAALGDYPPPQRKELLALVESGLSHCQEDGVSPEIWRKGLLSAEILAQLGLDSDTLAAALLHPAIASQPICLTRFQAQLSTKTVQMLNKLLNLRLLRPTNPTDAAQTEKLRRLLLALAADLRVMLVRIAEQLRDLRAARKLPAEKRQRLAQETQMIYAPLANRLGLGQIKWEMEDWTFRYLEPDTYVEIASLLDERRLDRERYIAETITQLQAEITKQGITAEVSGRPKHIYSIWRKMQRKKVGFDQILDVRAVRITVADVAQCYQVLGLVHSLWRPIPGEFDDYIASPKSNGYRSLHTAIIGSDGKPLEVQIRTQQMHQHAEQGVAAHWRYKEGGNASDYEALLTRLRQWLEQEPDARALNEGLAGEVLAERVYVFTPKGQIIELPRGATVLDFAYHIHSDIGHRCRGVKVNGRITPLTTAVENGQTVEVITGSQSAPSHDWLASHLGFLRTPKARSQVRQWFRQQNLEQNIQTGQEIIHREARRLGLGQIDWPLLLKRFNLPAQNEALAALGRGDISLTQLANALADQVLPPPAPELVGRSIARKAEANPSAVSVLGVGNLLTQMAKCCKPVPGEAIAGYITLGHGVTIHRADCTRLLELGATRHERLIEVEWGQPAENALYHADIQVTAHDRPGLLRDIGNLLANERINAVAVQTQSNARSSTADMRLTLELGNIAQLARVLDRINQLANVIEAKRLG